MTPERPGRVSSWQVAAPAAGNDDGSRLMRTLLNIIWVVLGGFWLFLGYLIFGLIACIFIKMIPVTCFPFGKRVVEGPGIL